MHFVQYCYLKWKWKFHNNLEFQKKLLFIISWLMFYKILPKFRQERYRFLVAWILCLPKWSKWDCFTNNKNYKILGQNKYSFFEMSNLGSSFLRFIEWFFNLTQICEILMTFFQTEKNFSSNYFIGR